MKHQLDRAAENREREILAEKLEDYGWDVLEEAWVEKAGSFYRADIVTSHPAYKELGLFLFELKKSKSFGYDITKAHKQIVYRYIGSRLNDLRWPTVKELLQVFIYCCPREKWKWGEIYVIKRFFNRYGIGLMFPDEDHVVFNPNDPHWSQLHLNPKENSSLDISRLKRYLEARTFGEE